MLAHIDCNAKKSDLLAAEPYLERWIHRNHDNATAIETAGHESNIIVGAPAAISVAA